VFEESGRDASGLISRAGAPETERILIFWNKHLEKTLTSESCFRKIPKLGNQITARMSRTVRSMFRGLGLRKPNSSGAFRWLDRVRLS